MQQIDTIQLAPKVPSIINMIINFFSTARPSTLDLVQVVSKFNYPDANLKLDSKQPSSGNYNQPICGGYNEAFVVQHRTSYHLR
jgi:hypothetical protein